MKKPLIWKFVAILGIVAAAAYFSYPPEEKINLGLDLRGGAHILMQVQTGSAVEYEMDLTLDRIGQRMKENGITYGSIVPADEAVLEIRGVPETAAEQTRAMLSAMLGQWDISTTGQGIWRVTMPASTVGAVERDAVERTLTILRKRVDALGVAEPTVQRQGLAGDRILVQLPGVQNLLRVKRLLQAETSLEWTAVSYPPGVNPQAWYPPATEAELLAQYGGTLPDDTEAVVESRVADSGSITTLVWPLKRVSTIRGNDLRNAYRDEDQWGSPAVGFELTQDAGVRFEAATRENRGKIMCVVLSSARSKEVISAPVIEGVIRDRGIIRGGFSLARAEDLALQLRSGAIPAEVDIIEERTVGPSLGRDSIRSGMISGGVGFLGVMLFMVVYYRLSGINAMVALSLNILLIFGTLGALPFLFQGARATLTLPGIAGLVLTVGMAVDSNVLIFERIREELGQGKTVRSAIEQGFGKAFLTILDCNVTTLVAAVFLFSYGSGPVKGFAVTLVIGLLASMFTAVFVSRQLFELALILKGPRAENLSI